MRERSHYFDFLKGIAILMVVGIHTVPKVTGFYSLETTVTILIRLLLNCAVPLFLAISGWFLSTKLFNNRHEIITFYRKRIIRVYIPLIICGMWLVYIRNMERTYWFGYSKEFTNVIYRWL